MSTRASPTCGGAQHTPSVQPRSSSSSGGKLLYYRGPSRRIPSPTNVLSIDRRDDDRVDDDDDGGVYASRWPLHRSADAIHATERTAARYHDGRQSATLRNTRHLGKEQTNSVASHPNDDAFFFYDPSWVSGDDKDVGPAASPSSAIARQDAGTSLASSPMQTSTRGNDRVPRQPSAKEHATLDVSPAPLSTAPQLGRGSARRNASPSHCGSEKEHHLRHLLRRYHGYVEDELQPQLERLKAALRDNEARRTRLHADNVILTKQLQRLESAGTAATSPLPADSTPANSTAFAASAPSAHEAHGGGNEADERLREASAEVALLKRKLESLQRQRARLDRHVGDGNVQLSPSPPASSPVSPSSIERSEGQEVARAELERLCRALSEDGLGFTEALSAVHERLSARRSGVAEVVTSSGGKDVKDGARAAPVRSPNPLKAAVEEWRRFARLTASPPLSTNSAVPSAEGNLLTTDSDVCFVCTTVLKALAATLQTEHSAVAAEVEAAQQAEKRLGEFVARQQRVVEQVRREAERRMEELEADHEAEVQTLENAIAELEQQVSMTAASRRPWTAGLLIHRPVDAPAVSSVISSNARGSQEMSAARRGPAARSGGGGSGSTIEDFSNARGAAGTRTGPAADRADAETQTALSLEWIQACLQKAREGPMRLVRREKEAELVELMSTEIESLRQQLTDSRAVATRLREEQRRFLGDVTLPLSYFDDFSSFPSNV